MSTDTSNVMYFPLASCTIEPEFYKTPGPRQVAMEKSTWWDDGRELAPGVVALAKPLRETVSIKFANYEASFLVFQNAWKQPIPHEFTPKIDLAVCLNSCCYSMRWRNLNSILEVSSCETYFWRDLIRLYTERFQFRVRFAASGLLLKSDDLRHSCRGHILQRTSRWRPRGPRYTVYIPTLNPFIAVTKQKNLGVLPF